jgi:hypothetical protein
LAAKLKEGLAMPEPETAVPATTSEVAVQVELKARQLDSILERFSKKPSKFNNGLDIAQKLVITFGLSIFTGYLAYQEFTTKQHEFQAKTFAGLFAEKDDARLEAAASAVNQLEGEKLSRFLRLVLSRFSDNQPRIRDYAGEGIVNMASTAYEPKKRNIIMNVVTEGLDRAQDQSTRERAAGVAEQIALPTSAFVNASSTVLTNPDENYAVTAKVCAAVGSLKWRTGDGITTAQLRTLKNSLADVVQRTNDEGVRLACETAVQNLARNAT